MSANPKKRKSKKTRSYKRNPVVLQAKRTRRRSSKRRNPHTFVAKSKRRSYRRHNPQFAGITASSILKLGGGALVGSLGSPALTSLVLGARNVGAVGILGNLGFGGLLTYLASLMDGTVASGVAAGTVSNVALRIWEVYITKVLPDGKGQAIAPAQAADAAANTPKLGDVRFSANGLGYYQHGEWPNVKITGDPSPLPQLVAAAGTASYKPAFA